MNELEKRKILLIDDDTSLLTTLRDFLSFEGYEVTTAASGEQGLKVLDTLEPDLIILDMSMPGMGGIGFLKAVSDARGKPRFPVLVLTARANMAEFFANVDVDGFIAKPCEPGDLLLEVARIIFLRSGVGVEREAAAADRPLKVLLGEDDTLARTRIENALAKNGCKVQVTGRGPDVMEQAIMTRPDVIVLKQVLPGMNGDKVAEMLKLMPNTQNTPIILYDDTGSRRPIGLREHARLEFVSGNGTESILAAVDRAVGR